VRTRLDELALWDTYRTADHQPCYLEKALGYNTFNIFDVWFSENTCTVLLGGRSFVLRTPLVPFGPPLVLRTLVE
jgi:hypothetical protein